MDRRFVIITEIYYDNEKVSRSRVVKESLDIHERNQIVRTLFYQRYGTMNIMDIYSSICVELNEKYGINISERTVMRALKKN